MYPVQQGQPTATTTVVATTANYGGNRQVSDAEFMQEIGSLHTLAIGTLVSGIICALTFWAVYYMGAFLAIGAIITGAVSISHASSVAAARTNSCCFSPRNAFHYMWVGNVFCLVCGIIGALVCILAIVFHTTWMRYVSIVGCLGCIGCALFGGMSFGRCDRVHKLCLQDMSINPTIVQQQPVVMVHQQYPPAQAYPVAQPAQGYPQQQQQGYGYPQQQPQQSGVYGQTSNGYPPQQQGGYYGGQQGGYNQNQNQGYYGQPPQQQQGTYQKTV